MLKLRKIYSVIIPFFVFLSNSAYGLSISSPSGNLSSSPVGVPIIINSGMSPIYLDLNEYRWVDDSGEEVHTGVSFIPKEQHENKKIKICSESLCSNELKIVIKNLDSMMPSGGNYWEFKDEIKNDLIRNGNETIKNTTTLSVKNKDESFVSISSVYYTLIESYSGEYLMSYKKYPYDYPLKLSVNLIDDIEINIKDKVDLTLCSFVTYTSGSLPSSSSQSCDIRLVMRENFENGGSTLIKPPTVKQHEALFPEVDFKVSEKQQYAATTNINNHNDRYCASISNYAKTVNSSSLSDFILSPSFNNSWPDEHYYWANDILDNENESHLVVSSGSSKGDITSGDQRNSFGYFTCEWNKSVIGLDQWSYNFSQDTPSGNSSVYFIIPEQNSITETNGQRTPGQHVWGAGNSDTKIKALITGKDEKEYLVELIGNKMGPYSYSNMKIEDGLQKGYGKIKIMLDNESESFESLPNQPYRGEIYVIAQGWHDSSFEKKIKVSIDFTKHPTGVEYPYKLELDEWSENFSNNTPSGNSSVYFTIPNQRSVLYTNGQREPGRVLWGGGASNTSITLSAIGDNGNVYPIDIIANKKGPNYNIKIEDGIQRGFGQIRLKLNKESEKYYDLPAQKYHTTLHIIGYGWHDVSYKRKLYLKLEFEKT